MYKLDWSLYPDFTEDEFRCKYTEECHMHPAFMSILQWIRDDYKKPIIISSGYRAPSHPVEAKKDRPGEHTRGMAADILCSGLDALELIKCAQSHNIKRIGLKQKGEYSQRFIHIGIADRFDATFPVAIWTY